NAALGGSAANRQHADQAIAGSRRRPSAEVWFTGNRKNSLIQIREYSNQTGIDSSHRDSCRPARLLFVKNLLSTIAAAPVIGGRAEWLTGWTRFVRRSPRQCAD